MTPMSACQPTPPPRVAAHQRDEQERQAVAQRAEARRLGCSRQALDQAGHGRGGQERARVQRERAPPQQPQDQECQPGREHDQVAGDEVRCREQPVDEQQPAEDDEEDADPRQLRPAVLLATPLPAIDADRPRFGRDRVPSADPVRGPRCPCPPSSSRRARPAGSPVARPDCPDAAARSSSSSTWLNPKRSARRPSGPGRPPVPATEQAHRRRHEQHANDGRVQQNCKGHPDADALDGDRLGQRERGEHGDHDQRGAGDHAGRLGQAVGDGRRVVAGPAVRLLDPRQEQHLVVHGQADQDREHDDRVAGDGVAQRLERRAARGGCPPGRSRPARRSSRSARAGSSGRP